MKTTNTTNSVNLIKKAEHIDITHNETGGILLTVNDEQTRLSRRHPIAVSTSLTSPDDVKASLLGGYFTFVNDGTHNELKEWRDSSYTGFIQTDEFLDRFGNDASLFNRANETLEISEFGKGGVFDISASFNWSSFSKNLKTQVSVLRQICSNGMVARRPMFEREVPVINLFDHHLDIAARQLVDISGRIITNRIEQMGREHATVKEVSLIATHVDRRYKDAPHNHRIKELKNVIENALHIEPYYTKNAIDSGLANALEAPISRFDLWNIATELNSHTHELVESTSSAIDRLASGLVFPRDIGRPSTALISSKSTFGSPEQAFFGS